jgi:L-fucose mutarotase
MLKGRLLHPVMLSALGRAGHGAKVLIADGNYPFSTGAPATAERAFLNLAPGLVTVPQVLDALVGAIPIEGALVMTPPDGAAQPIFEEFRKLLPAGTPLESRNRFEFYAEAKSADTVLVVATGEQRRFANLLLTIGVVRGEET